MTCIVFAGGRRKLGTRRPLSTCVIQRASSWFNIEKKKARDSLATSLLHSKNSVTTKCYHIVFFFHLVYAEMWCSEIGFGTVLFFF